MTEYRRRQERMGTEAASETAALMEGEIAYATDTRKLKVSDGSKTYDVTTDNVVSKCADHADPSEPLSLAWWLARAGNAETTLRVPKGTHHIGGDVSVPSNIALRFDKGAVLNIAAGRTLTIKGPVEAGLWRIFGGEGSVAGTPSVQYIRPEWYGAKDDAATDSTAAIQKALDMGDASKIPVKLSAGEFIVTGTIHMKDCDADFGEATLYADGTEVGLVVRCGYNERGSFIYGRDIKLPKVFNFTDGAISYDWAGTNIGVELSNASNCRFTVRDIVGFTRALRTVGYGEGFAYNEVGLNLLGETKIALELAAEEADGVGGWCNENIYYNGRLVAKGRDTWEGTRNILISQGNNNLFIKPSLESADVEYCVEFIEASYITFINGRYERSGAKKMLLSPSGNSSVHSLLFIGGYQLEGVYFTNNTEYTCPNIQVFSRNYCAGTAIAASYSGIYQADIDFTKQSFTDGIKENAYNYIGPLGFLYRYSPSATPGGISTTNFDLFLGNSSGYIGLMFHKPINDDGGCGLYGWGTQLAVKAKGGVIPRLSDGSTGNQTLGTASFKWDALYAANGAIQTSDRNSKTEIRPLSEAERAAALKCKGLIKAFKMKEAVEKKGSEAARIHVGAIAQEVMEAFESEGLDPMRYGIVCYDEWEETTETVVDAEEVRDENGTLITPAVTHEVIHPAGSLYSIRYDELLAFIVAAV